MSTTLSYFLAQKSPFLVVSLIGELTEAAKPQLERCFTEALASKAEKVIISFHDISAITPEIIPTLVKGQMSLRQNSSGLRLCFLKTEHRKFLVERGAIRQEEICEDLERALQSLR